MNHLKANLALQNFKIFFCIDQKSKMATNTGHSFNKVPYGKMKKKNP
jgi:hypothetical protein